MYLYEKQLGRIKVSELVPNMEAIKALKDQEVYGKLDYLTMMRAETDLNADTNILLQDRDSISMGEFVNVTIPAFNPGYHRLEQDNVSVREAFVNLSKVINTDVLKIVKYLENNKLNHLALTDPRYRIVAIRGNREIKEMIGIVPVTERLYQANELVRRIQEGNLELMYQNMPEGYFKENSELLQIRYLNTPNMWLSNLEDLYNYGVINGSIEDFDKKLEISDEIMSRIRRK